MPAKETAQKASNNEQAIACRPMPFLGAGGKNGYRGIGKVGRTLKRLYSGRLLAFQKRWSRVREWIGVVRAEVGLVGAASVAVSLAKAGLWRARQGEVAPRTWRARIRACASCPVYDRGRHACRDLRGLGLGCGCWMPAKAKLAGDQCWRKRLDGGGHRE